MQAEFERPSRRPPDWLIRTIWRTHRTLLRITGGRFGLRDATTSQWGMLRLTTVGRRSGRARVAILGFIEDGANVVTPAMNGWMEPEPAWWLNLQANPEATVALPSGEVRAVRARAADAGERQRLWRQFLELGSSAFTDANARLRSHETALVVLEPAAPRAAAGPQAPAGR
jgi:F420H(2)-dependent quinone reductase